MMKKWIFIISAFLTCPVWGFDQSHAQFNSVLKKFNANGLIHYQELKREPGTLEDYLSSLGEVSTDEYQTWNKNEQLAFWINAYNAYTLKAIINNHPIKSSFLKSAIFPKNSIRQINGVWDKLEWNVMGNMMTLNQIEHEVIRAEFQEPRVHMALVCAALGCPRLRHEPYIGTKIENQLKDDVGRFLTLPFQFRIDFEKNVVYLSSIFKWFGEDFIPQYGQTPHFTQFGPPERAVLNFITNNSEGKTAAYLKSNQFEISYTEYDWTLNEQK